MHSAAEATHPPLVIASLTLLFRDPVRACGLYYTPHSVVLKINT